MNWLKELIERLFFKSKIKLLEEPKNIMDSQENQNDFILKLKRHADIEQDDGNGYKIIPNMRLEDMV